MQLEICTHVSGSYCVIYKNKEHYIDCRSSRKFSYTDIECVRNGHVYMYVQIQNDFAPAYILKLVKQELL